MTHADLPFAGVDRKKLMTIHSPSCHNPRYNFTNPIQKVVASYVERGLKGLGGPVP